MSTQTDEALTDPNVMGEDPRKCPTCGDRFKSPAAVKRHMNKMHGRVPDKVTKKKGKNGRKKGKRGYTRRHMAGVEPGIPQLGSVIIHLNYCPGCGTDLKALKALVDAVNKIRGK